MTADSARADGTQGATRPTSALPDSVAPFALVAGMRGWPTVAGVTRGVVVGTRVRYGSGWFRVRADAAVTDRAPSGVGGGGPRILDGRFAVATAPLARGVFGIDGATGVSRDAYDPRTTWVQRGAQVRGWVGTPAVGAWAGTGAFAPRGTGTTPNATEVRAGGWTVRGPVALSVLLRRVRTSGLVAVGGDSSGIIPSTCRAAYDPAHATSPTRTICQGRFGTVDAHVGGSWLIGTRYGLAALRARAGRRIAASGARDTPHETWAAAGITAPSVGPLALSVDVARQPVDIVRNIPAATRFFAGLRWIPRPAPSAAAPPSPRTAVRAPSRAAAGVRTLAVALGAAGVAEVEGDFTDWRPVPLRRAGGGTWEAQFVIAPGVHTLAVRVDGGPWQVPPGLPSTDDGFGGTVGTLVVESAPPPTREP